MFRGKQFYWLLALKIFVDIILLTGATMCRVGRQTQNIKMNRKETGWVGENIACLYLKDKGYKILERNFRKPWGEIDVIAKDPDGVLIFVEVKSMHQKEGFKPEDQYSFSKAHKVKRAAQLFIGRYPWLVGDSGFRIDLVAILVNNPILTDYKKDCEIRHYENV